MTLYTKENSQSVKELFSRVAKQYDRTNIALSWGLCNLWMKKLVRELKGTAHLGDLCAGTGAVALTFLKQNPSSSALLYDFCPEMLEIANTRMTPKLKERASIKCGDCHELTLADQSFDALSMAYGLRNLKEPLSALKEAHRVLKPEGKLFILELTRPKSSLLFSLHKLYLRLFVPLIGKILTDDQEAYRYLARTVSHFSPPETIVSLLQSAGFKEIKCKRLSFGIATLLSAKKSCA